VTIDVLVVGAGLAGSVIAERCASSGKQVLVLDRRDHIGGNAYDEFDSNGVLVHRYGPHIFHTNAQHVADYLSSFTSWRPYEHRVLASVEGKLLPIPINQTTINQLYGLDLDEHGIRDFFHKVREQRTPIRNSEDLVLSSVGPDLCDKFFRGYTRKQWGMDLSELSAGVAARIPTRSNCDDRYFTDSFQAMPADGYTKMFERMLNHKNIRVQLGTDYHRVKNKFSATTVYYTGRIDAYFEHRFGELPYRSLRFEHQHIADCSRFQKVGTVNYPNENQFTRITEFKHLTGQSHEGTSIVREYPQSEGEPYYPILTMQNDTLSQQYKALAKAENNVFFVGRLAEYRYYNMDQVVAAALKIVGDEQNG
jgi:UDP-galactopyranose mutase